MIKKTKELAGRTIQSVKTFKEDPINNLAFLIVMAMVLISIISGFVSFIMFIFQGGYSNQIESLQNNGIDGITSGFTSGTVGLITSGITSKIMHVLVMAELIVMLVAYFKNSNKTKRVIMIVDLVLCTIIIFLSAIIFWIAVGELVVTEQDAYKYLGAFDGMTINLRAVLIIYLIVAAVALITFIVLVFITKECRWMVGYTALALLFAKIAVPLFFLVVENIIPLVTGAVVLVVIGVLMVFGFKMFFSSSDSSSASTTSSGRDNYSYQREEVRETKVETKSSNQKVIKDWTGPFWKDKGGYGAMTPQSDCIYVKNSWGEKTYVCTVFDFEKGNVAIIDHKSKNRVMNIAGCKTPEK